MLRRPNLLTTILAIIVVAALAVTGTAPAQQPRVRIGVGLYAGFITPWIAEEQGYFKDEGLDVKTFTFATGVAAWEALQAGRIEISHAVVPGSLTLYQKQPNFMSVGAMAWSTDSIVLVAKKNITKPSDFVGKTAGVILGTGNHYLLIAYLRKHGINEKDLTIKNMQPTDAIAALEKGDIDISATHQPHGWKHLEVSGDKVHLVTTQRGYWVDRTLITVNRKWANDNRDTMVRVLRAYQRATKLLQSDLGPAVKLYVERFKMGEELAKKYSRIMQYDMTFSREVAQDVDEVSDLWVERGWNPRKVDWRKDFDLSFLKAVSPDLVKFEPK